MSKTVTIPNAHPGDSRVQDPANTGPTIIDNRRPATARAVSVIEDSCISLAASRKPHSGGGAFVEELIASEVRRGKIWVPPYTASARIFCAIACSTDVDAELQVRTDTDTSGETKILQPARSMVWEEAALYEFIVGVGNGDSSDLSVENLYFDFTVTTKTVKFFSYTVEPLPLAGTMEVED